MHRIDTATAKNGEFTDGNPSGGVKATQLNAAWFNTVQRELCAVVEGAGEELSETDDGQVASVIEKLRNADWKTFSARGESATFALGEWTGNSLLFARAGGTPSGLKFPANVSVSQDGLSGISLLVAETNGKSCGVSYKCRNNTAEATLHSGDIAVLYSSNYGGTVPWITVLPNAAHGNFDSLNVSGTIEAKTIYGTNQGQGTSKYLVLGNTTVSGDLDVKAKAILGNGLVVVDNEELKETVGGDLEVSGKITAGSLETAGEMSADVVMAERFALPKSGTAPYENVSATCFKDSSENCEPPCNAGVGTIGFVHNSGTAQIKVYLGYRADGKRRYVNLNAGSCGTFMCLSTTDSGSYTVPLFNAVIQVES